MRVTSYLLSHSGLPSGEGPTKFRNYYWQTNKLRPTHQVSNLNNHTIFFKPTSLTTNLNQNQIEAPKPSDWLLDLKEKLIDKVCFSCWEEQFLLSEYWTDLEYLQTLLLEFISASIFYKRELRRPRGTAKAHHNTMQCSQDWLVNDYLFQLSPSLKWDLKRHQQTNYGGSGAQQQPPDLYSSGVRCSVWAATAPSGPIYSNYPPIIRQPSLGCTERILAPPPSLVSLFPLKFCSDFFILCSSLLQGYM